MFDAQQWFAVIGIAASSFKLGWEFKKSYDERGRRAGVHPKHPRQD